MGRSKNSVSAGSAADAADTVDAAVSPPPAKQAVSVKVDPAVWLRAKVYSVTSGISPSIVVEQALTFYLDSLESSGKKKE